MQSRTLIRVTDWPVSVVYAWIGWVALLFINCTDERKIKKIPIVWLTDKWVVEQTKQTNNQKEHYTMQIVCSFINVASFWALLLTIGLRVDQSRFRIFRLLNICNSHARLNMHLLETIDWFFLHPYIMTFLIYAEGKKCRTCICRIKTHFIYLTSTLNSCMGGVGGMWGCKSHHHPNTPHSLLDLSGFLLLWWVHFLFSD